MYVHFEVAFHSRSYWHFNPPEFSSNWYTDGSKTSEGTGAGIYGENASTEISVSLGKYTSIFQAEVHAIELCAREIFRTKPSNKNFCIFSHSESAIKALVLPSIKSKLVLQCLGKLNELANENNVQLGTF